MTPAFAEVAGLTLRHIGRREPALRELDLRWEEGERLLLLGPSGSGKSTLALCLNGVIPHALDAHWEAGTVRVAGADTRTTPLGTLTDQVGVLFQDPETQLVMLEVDDEIAFGLENHAVPRAEMRRRIAAVRALMGLTGDRVPERIAALSGGTKQRLTIASLLALAPPGLVLDEPTANLDPQSARSVAGAIADLCRDRSRSLLLIEHQIDQVLAHVDRVAVLNDQGSLALEGSVDQVFGADLGRLDALGVWIPELTTLVRLLGSPAVPRTTAEAARLIAAGWPADRRRLAAPTSPTSAASVVGRPILEARAVGYRYSGAASDALSDATLSVAPGEFVALVGANGAGKSTLGLLLAGALRPAHGSIALDGSDLRTVGERVVRARIAYVFQYPEHQFIAQTVQGEIEAGLRKHGVRSADPTRRVNDALERAGLARLAAASPHALSHGQKRRLSVATALIMEPDVLILDEPTFGQDRRHADRLLATLDDLHRDGQTIIVITHDLGIVADHATRAVALAAGRIAFDGSPAALFANAVAADTLLARCGLALPPVAEAFRIAQHERPDLPGVFGLRDAARALVR